MENNLLPIVKVFDVDYSFIIKNYYHPSLWDKEWTLFVYKNYVFKLSLCRIDCYDKSICFKIKLDSDLDIWNKSVDTIIWYYTKNMTIDFLKKQINNALKQLVVDLERVLIRETDSEYKRLIEVADEEEERLREIAENYLDENNVTNDDIREPYIDRYISDYRTLDTLSSEYLSECTYTRLSNLHLIVARTIKDEELEEAIVKANNKSLNELLNKFEEDIQYVNSEDWETDMESELEEVYL